MIKGDIGRPSPEKAIEKEEAPAADETSQLLLKALRQFTKDGQKISLDDNLELDLGLDSLENRTVASLEKTFDKALRIFSIYILSRVDRDQHQEAGAFPRGVENKLANILATEPRRRSVLKNQAPCWFWFFSCTRS
jgi:hypothetical protein